MLNKSIPSLDLKQIKDKRFVRSRSGGQNTLPESPRMHFVSGMGQHFANKFISQANKNAKIEVKDKENRTDQSLKEPCSNRLGDKLKSIQLEEELKKSQAERQSLKEEVKILKQQLAGREGKSSKKRALSTDKKGDKNAQKESKVGNGNANLRKLKQKIAQSRLVEPISDLQKAQNRNKELQRENINLKLTIKQLQSALSELKVNSTTNNRQHTLQQTVYDLQTQIRHAQQENRKLDLMLKINLSKSVNFEQNKDNILREQLQSLKMRHNKLICQHNQLRKQIKHINSRQPSPRKEKYLTVRSRVDGYDRSLSLSPETDEKRY